LICAEFLVNPSQHRGTAFRTCSCCHGLKLKRQALNAEDSGV
jgi:hypothetical protein